MTPDLQHIIPAPALPPLCIHSVQSYLFITLCPARIIHFPSSPCSLRADGQVTGQGLTRTETHLGCLELAGHHTACMGTKIHPMHWRLGYLVTALLLCAHLWSLLGMSQH